MKNVQPSSIFIAEVVNINPSTKLLKEISRDQYILKSWAEEQVKVQPKTKTKPNSEKYPVSRISTNTTTNT